MMGVFWLDIGYLYSLQTELQEHGHQNVRSRVLPEMRGRANDISAEEMPELQQDVRDQRSDAYYTLSPETPLVALFCHPPWLGVSVRFFLYTTSIANVEEWELRGEKAVRWKFEQVSE